MEKHMKKTVENFGTAQRTQEAYDRLMRRFDSLEQLVKTACYFIAFFCTFCVTGLLLQIF